jgi:AraC-like DNA-binding protein/predicted transcriptional regulator YdeE
LQEWEKSVQDIIDLVEDDLSAPPSLDTIASKVSYSPFYATKKFREHTGMTLREYIRMRKVSQAVLDLRNTDMRILDIAVKYGFSSQEAFTRSFIKAFGLTPSTYRRMPKPLPLLIKRNVYNPYYLGLGELKIMKDVKKDITIAIQVLPEHRFVGIKNINADGYFEFWAEQEKIPGQDCDTVCGLLSSIIGEEGFNGQIGGWFYEDGKRGYIYGVELPTDYAGELPEFFEDFIVPEGKYVVFHHPPYDFDTMDPSVFNALCEVEESWDPSEHGFKFDDRYPTYQRHDTEKYGQAFMRRVEDATR